VPADGDEPKQKDRHADERTGDRAYDLELQRLGIWHGEPIGEAAGFIVQNNAAGPTDVPLLGFR
jgi:hypothetical protein